MQRNKQFVEETHRVWGEHFDAIKHRIPRHISENLYSLHDATIEGGEMSEGAFVLRIKQGSGNHWRIRTITFEDCELLQLDEPLKNGWWNDVEIDFTDDGRYRIGILFHGRGASEDVDEQYRVLELYASSIAIERDEYTEEELEQQRVMQARIQRVSRKTCPE